MIVNNNDTVKMIVVGIFSIVDSQEQENNKYDYKQYWWMVAPFSLNKI